MLTSFELIVSHFSSTVNVKRLESPQRYFTIASQPLIDGVGENAELINRVLQCSCCFITLVQIHASCNTTTTNNNN